MMKRRWSADILSAVRGHPARNEREARTPFDSE
jgi:hypothetical protein